MIERGEEAGFSIETREAIGIGGKGGGQHFDGHIATKRHVTCAIHLSHAARSDAGSNLVGSDASPWVQRGSLWRSSLVHPATLLHPNRRYSCAAQYCL